MPGAEHGSQEQVMKGQGGNKSLRRVEKQDWIDSTQTASMDKPFNTQATLGTSASCYYIDLIGMLVFAEFKNTSHPDACIA